MLYYRTLIGRYARFRLLSSYSLSGGWFICWTGGLVGCTATRQLRRRSTSHEQEVKENVLARPAADAREPSLSLSLSLSFSHSFVNLSSSFASLARSLRYTSRSFDSCLDPTFDPRILYRSFVCTFAAAM